MSAENEQPIVNKVAASPLVSLDLADYIDSSGVVELDLADWLFQRMLLKEKDFRQQLKIHDWKQYDQKIVHVHCSEDAIIPSWAYMLIITKLYPYTDKAVVGGIADVERLLVDEAVTKIKLSEIEGKKIVVKGCGSLTIRDYAYSALTKHLLPHVSSIMYGEPCSTVPVYKKASI